MRVRWADSSTQDSPSPCPLPRGERVVLGTLSPSGGEGGVRGPEVRGHGCNADQPAVVAAAVGVEKVGAAARAEARVVYPVAAKPRASQLFLVGGPEIEHPLAQAHRSDPGAPPPREGRIEPRDHRLVHLVAAGPYRRSDGGQKVLWPATRLHQRQDGHPRHRLGGAAPARVNDREPPPVGVVDQERHAVGGKDRDRQPRPVSDESVGGPRQATHGRAEDIGAVDLLEEGRRLRSEAALGEQGRGVGTERRERVSEGRHAREVARGEEMRHSRAFEQRRDEVRRRVTLEARSGHGIRHCLTRGHAAPVWPRRA